MFNPPKENIGFRSPMQYALPLYLLFLACVLVRHAVVSVTSSILKGPVFGDWLVNYSDGFMRRGYPAKSSFC